MRVFWSMIFSPIRRQLSAIGRDLPSKPTLWNPQSIAPTASKHPVVTTFPEAILRDDMAVAMDSGAYHKRRGQPFETGDASMRCAFTGGLLELGTL